MRRCLATVRGRRDAGRYAVGLRGRRGGLWRRRLRPVGRGRRKVQPAAHRAARAAPATRAGTRTPTLHTPLFRTAALQPRSAPLPCTSAHLPCISARMPCISTQHFCSPALYPAPYTAPPSCTPCTPALLPSPPLSSPLLPCAAHAPHPSPASAPAGGGVRRATHGAAHRDGRGLHLWRGRVRRPRPRHRGARPAAEAGGAAWSK